MNNNKNETLWKIRNTRMLGLLLIIIGISIRIFMLIYYYIVHLDPSVSWGDLRINFNTTNTMFTGEWIWAPTKLEYPPLTLYLLVFFKFISFGSLELFAFYAFLLELLVSLSFYFVLKKFNVPNIILVLGVFLVNPFIFLNNVFSPLNCGYHITDSFFYIFLILSLFYYLDENKSKFYLFSGLTMCTKWFTLPAAPYFFIKFLLEKDWKEMKKFIIFLGVPILIFLVSPLLYLPNYIDLYTGWLSGSNIPIFNEISIFVKLGLFLAIFLGYLIIRIKKADFLEITFFSIVVMFSIMFWRRLYVRYLTPLVLYGHLKTNENIFTIDIDFKIIHVNFRVGNNLITYGFSILGCLAAIAIIIFIF
ncbi:MAG: hypothetical protein JSV62_14340 [Promethearchaeota archaeon]|nr:MAG: hypothetical protein JSV62_14340 [Candidatus Lokiarchaeota archaeon]